MAMATAEDGTIIKYRKNLGSSDKVLDAWMDQSQPDGWDRSGGNFFFRGDTIYSYGHHFPMAIRRVREDGSVFYLINGDTYGNTTSKHQGWVRGAITGTRWPANGGATTSREYFIIPFSAMSRAGVQPRNLTPIHSEGERTWIETRREKVYRSVERIRYQDGEWKDTDQGFRYVKYDQPKAIPYQDHEWTGEYEEKPHERHLMGSTLFKAEIQREERVEMPVGHHCAECCYRNSPQECDAERRYIRGGYNNHTHHNTVTETAFFISGLDETSRITEYSFFLTRLDLNYWKEAHGQGALSSVEEAYRSMQPLYVKDCLDMGVDVKRQGDWWFVPLGNNPLSQQLARLDRRKLVKSSQYLERPDGLGARQMGATRHLVTRLAVMDDKMYVRGMVRHDVSRQERNRGDVHKAIKLGDVWHLAIPNIQLGSWSTGGRVD